MRGLGVMTGLGLALLAASSAWATTTFTQAPGSGIANPVTATTDATSGGAVLTGATIYASQGVQSSAKGGTIVIPAGIAVTLASSAATTANEATGVLTFTLPPGVSFQTVPTATLLSVSTVGTTTSATGPIASNGIAAGTINGNTLTFKLTTAAQSAATSSAIQLSNFFITNANALATPGNSITIQAQVTGFTANGTSTILLNDTKPVTATIATSVSGAIATAAAGPGDTIAVTSTTIGTAFNSFDIAAATGASTPTVIANVADIAKISVSANSQALNAPAAAAQFTSSDLGNLAVSGVFSNYSGGYLAPGSVCTSTTPPTGSIVGSLTTNTLIFSGVPLSGTLRAVCLLAGNAALLSPTGPLTATFSLAGQTQAISGLSNTGIIYAGTPFNLTYVFARTGGYQGYLRMVNTTAVSQPVFGIARTDAGQVAIGLIATLAPQSAQLITHDSAFQAIGAASIFTPGTRGVLTALTPAPGIGGAIPGISAGNASGVSVTSLVLNPTSDVTNAY